MNISYTTALTSAASFGGVLRARPKFAELGKGGSLSFPQFNGRDSDPNHQLSLRQPAQNWFEMWGTNSALFAIVRRSRAATHFNESYALVDGLSNDNGRDSYVVLHGGRYGTVDWQQRIEARIATSGYRPVSQVITEDAFLLVVRRSDESGVERCSVDWYSLADGTRYAGDATQQVYVPQALPADQSEYGFNIGGASGALAGWPGEIGCIGYVEGAVSVAEWQAIALGGEISALTESGHMIKWLRCLTGDDEGLVTPDWLATDSTFATEANGTMRAGSSLRRMEQSTFLHVDEWPEGTVLGVMPGATQAACLFSGTSAGLSGAIEVRVSYESDGAVLKDWGVVAEAAPEWSGEVSLPISSRGWCVAQFRMKGSEQILFEGRRRIAAGYKFLQLGQSQTDIYLTARDRGRKTEHPWTASYVTNDSVANGGKDIDAIQHYLLGDLASDGVSAFLDQFRTICPNVPVQIVDAAVSGTGPNQLISDANAGRDWLMLQQKLDYAGNDVSVVLMNWATQGWNAEGTVAETLDALLDGSGGYSGVINHTLTDALKEGFTVGVSPATRHSRGAHEGLRQEQVAQAHLRSLTVGLPVSDYAIASAGGPHPDNLGDGNLVFGVRQALLAAEALQLVQLQNPGFAAARRNGDRIEIDLSLPNGGAVYCATPASLEGFEVYQEGDLAFHQDGFTAALEGETVVLTSTNGEWTAGIMVRALGNGPKRSDGDAAAESAIIDSMLYETWADDVLGRGLPIGGTTASGQWEPDWTVTLD
jgi:hypothetical protein